MKYILHSDPGHAWLEVSKAEIRELKIGRLISSFSYANRFNAFLEEDCDMSVFIEAWEKHYNLKWSYLNIVERVYQNSEAPLRNLPSYK